MNSRRVELDVVRIICMIEIILCHTLCEQGLIYIGEFFSASSVFLFISGSGFGGREVQNWGKWLSKRFWRILPEYYIFLVFYLIFYSFVTGGFPLKNALINIFLLQGLFTDLALPNVGHLWFVTYILICYLLTPFLQLCFSKSKRPGLSLLTILVVLQIIVIPFRVFGIYLVAARFSAYILGYYFSAVMIKRDGHDEGLSIRRFAIYSTCPAAVLNVIRFVYESRGLGAYLPSLADNLISMIWQWSHLLLGLWLFCVLWCAAHKFTSIRPLGSTAKNVIYKMSLYSYSVYMVHQVFVYHDFALTRYIHPYALGLIVALIAVVVAAVVLYQISDLLRRYVGPMKLSSRSG